MPIPRRRLIVLFLVAAALTLVGVALALRSRIDPERLRADFLAALRKMFPEDAAAIRLGSAQLDLQSGIILRDFGLRSPPGEPREFLRAERVLLRIDTAALAAGTIRAREVEVEGLVLDLLRPAAGAWIPGPLRAAWDRSRESSPAADFPIVKIRNGRIHFRDEDRSGEPLTGVLEGITVAAAAARRDPGGAAEPILFSADGKGGFLRSFRVSGRWDPAPAILRLENFVAEVDLAHDVEAVLPGEIRERLRGLGLGGRLEVTGSAGVGSDGSISGLRAVATAIGGEVVLPPTGFAIRAISGAATIEDGRIRIERVSGLAQNGACEISGTLDLRRGGDGGLEIAGAEIAADFHRLSIQEDVLPAVDRETAAALARHRLRGMVRLRARVKAEGRAPRREDWTLVAEPLGLSLSYSEFPYPIDNLQGEITISGGRAVVDPERPLRGTAGSGRLEASGWIAFEPGEGEGGGTAGVKSSRIAIKVEDAIIDDAVREALGEEARRVWDDFSPFARGDLEIEVSRGADDSPPRAVVALAPRTGRFKYRSFPVALDHLHGRLMFDLLDQAVEIPALTARHHQRQIEGAGTVNYAPGKEAIDLRISCDALALDGEILAALPEAIRAPLIENRVSGEVGIDVHLSARDGGAVTPRVDLAISELIAHPPAFPLAVVLAEGRMEFDGRDLHLRGLKSRGEPEFTFDGLVLRPSPEEMRVQLRGVMSNLAVDDRLLGFLAPGNREAMRAAGLRGNHDFEFETDILYQAPPGTPRTFTYRISKWRTRDAGMDAGVHLSGIELEGELEGEGTVDGAHRLSGKAVLRAARFNRLLIRDADLEFAYGRLHPALASPAAGAAGDGGFTVGQDFRDRLSARTTGKTLQVLVRRADLYGGAVRGFLYADLGELHDMRGDFAAERIDLGAAARDIFEAGDARAKGTATGTVQFRGLTGNPSSILGVGSVEVVDGSFAGIPLFSQMLDLLAPGAGEKIGFTALAGKFSIKDERFHTLEDGLLLRGPGLNLRGEGTMDFYGALELQLVPEVIDLKLPLVDQVKKNLVKVHLAGTLVRPRCELVLLRVLPAPVEGK